MYQTKLLLLTSRVSAQILQSQSGCLALLKVSTPHLEQTAYSTKRVCECHTHSPTDRIIL